MGLPAVSFNDGGEERVIFTLPPTERSDLESVMAFALPKAGSVLLDSMLRMACKEMQLPYVSLPEHFFRLGLPDNLIPASTSLVFVPHGYCYGGFRYFPEQYEIPILRRAKKILLVRDPRDMLVSHYFSMRSSHPAPGTELKSSVSKLPQQALANEVVIDSYVMQIAPWFKKIMGDYRKLCTETEVRIFRYEDVIYRKAEWLQEIVTYFNWPVSGDIVRTIAARNDVIPESEDETRHVRQVHPGNYKRKLKPETVEQINRLLHDEIRYFGYA